MQAAILVLTAVFCLANLAADLLYGVVDPGSAMVMRVG